MIVEPTTMAREGVCPYPTPDIPDKGISVELFVGNIV